LTPFILTRPCTPHALWKREEEMKEKAGFCRVHVATC